ncbi:MAG: amidohydrolase [Candidatus Nanopelagicales bacterium]
MAYGGVDLVLRDGAVWTGVRRAGQVVTAHAVAIGGGRVLALGDEAEALADAATSVVGLEGGTLVPGFGDGHAHPTQGGIAALFADVGSAGSVDEVVAAVREWAAAHPDAEWVRGEGYDPSLAPRGEFDARWLDAAVPDRPVVLRATDYHTAWVNSRALELAGIGQGTPQPADGEIVLRADGTPMGTLREWGAWRPVYALVPALDRDTRVAAVEHATETYAAAGVTWLQDAWVEDDVWTTWRAGHDAGLLRQRVNLALLAEPGRWREDLPGLVERRREVEAHAPGVLSARTVKFFADGILEGGTAALLEPYCDCPTSHGMPNWEPAELAAAVTAVVGAGFQPHIHAIGDAGVRAALDAVRAAVREHGTARRPVIAHAQLVDPDDLLRFRDLGVVANFEPLWAQLDPAQTELTLPRLGQPRGDRQYPIATLLRSGAPVSFGSDWPVSSPVPLRGIAVAVTRQTPDGRPPGGWVPAERLTLDEALLAYTAGVAHQAGEEGLWGRIVPGARADLAWLAARVHELDPAALPEVAVAGTWLAGIRVHG